MTDPIASPVKAASDPTPVVKPPKPAVDTQSLDHLRHYSDPAEIGVTTSDDLGTW